MKEKMIANIENMRKGDNVSANRKENNFTEQYTLYALDILAYNGKPIEMVTIRIYRTGARASACIWIDSKETFFTGGGNSGKNVNSHLSSIAVERAFSDAGITFSKEIGGCGELRILEDMEAVADAMNSKQYFIGHAHG